MKVCITMPHDFILDWAPVIGTAWVAIVVVLVIVRLLSERKR